MKMTKLSCPNNCGAEIDVEAQIREQKGETNFVLCSNCGTHIYVSRKCFGLAKKRLLSLSALFKFSSEPRENLFEPRPRRRDKNNKVKK